MQHLDSGMNVLLTAHSLYHSTLQGDWNEALETYGKDASIHSTAINSSGDTALHVAVNDDKEEMVLKLVDAIRTHGELSALETKNKRGDTALHCAASRGSLKMCLYIIAQAHGDGLNLLELRNMEGETPLFLAALYGHRDLFLHLHSIGAGDHSNSLWKRTSDGETVLHCTLQRELFELAFAIILLYGDEIVGSVDEKGITPLHILASKPSAFESSSNFRLYNKLVYDCIIVEPLKTLDQRSKNDKTMLSWIKLFQKAHTAAGADAENPGYEEYENVPPNCRTCYDIFVRAFTFFIHVIVVTFGLQDIKHLREKKRKHVWCRQILNELWRHRNVVYVGGGSALKGYLLPSGGSSGGDDGASAFPKPGDVPRQQDDGSQSQEKDKNVNEDENLLKDLRELLRSSCKGQGDEEEKTEEGNTKESALFIAAKNGVLEILEKILKDKPGAIHENNSQGQNVMHVAVKYRQPHVFELLMKQRLQNNLLQGVDNDGNTVLHLAAKLSHYKPWHIPGSALQMQWEIKWFLYIVNVTPKYLPFLKNKDKDTPRDIFRKDHEGLVKEGAEWLKSTSESCSVVAALIAGVAFATSTTVPGGTQEDTGKPNLVHHPAFNMFAVTSLLALCCSITSLVMFLAILTSRQQPRDFHKDLPFKLLMGLSSLFFSIAFILVSFSAAFFFVVKDNLQHALLPCYAVAILPLTFYGVAQFPLYADLVRAIFSKVPQSSNRETEKLIL